MSDKVMQGFDVLQQDFHNDPARTAIIALHWQNDVVTPKGAFGSTFADAVSQSGVIERTAKLIDGARNAGCLIIFVNIVYRPGYSGIVQNNALFRRAVTSEGFITHTPGAAIIDKLQPFAGDIVIDHARSSAFFGSDLLTILIGNGIRTVAIGGIATNVAVDHTARDAMQYGFDTVLLEDCCFSSDIEHHRAALVTLRVLCSAVITGAGFLNALGPSSPAR